MVVRGARVRSAYVHSVYISQNSESANAQASQQLNKSTGHVEGNDPFNVESAARNFTIADRSRVTQNVTTGATADPFGNAVPAVSAKSPSIGTDNQGKSVVSGAGTNIGSTFVPVPPSNTVISTTVNIDAASLLGNPTVSTPALSKPETSAHGHGGDQTSFPSGNSFPSQELIKQPTTISSQQDPNIPAKHSTGRPGACMTFGFGGTFFVSGGTSVKEMQLGNLMKERYPDWYESVREFPGPLGQANKETTAKVQEYVSRQVAGLFDQEWWQLLERCAAPYQPNAISTGSSLLMPAKHARFEFSAKVLWSLLGSMLSTEGNLENAFSHFLKQFEASIVKTFQVGNMSPLQQVARFLAVGNHQKALQIASESGLWTHALIVSRMVSVDAYNVTLNLFAKHVSGNESGTGVATELTAVEASDPYVQALLTVYKLVGQQVPVQDLSVLKDAMQDLNRTWIYYTLMAVSLLGTKVGGSASGRSNATGGEFAKWPHICEKFLTHLGNTLISPPYSDACAAHTAYLLTGAHTLQPVDHPNELMALLGVEHKNTKNFKYLLEPFALEMSEVYEYARRLCDSQFFSVSIQPFKMSYAYVLTDLGLRQISQRYLELLVEFRKAAGSSKYSDAFRVKCRELADRLQPPERVDLTKGDNQLIGIKVANKVAEVLPGTGFLSGVLEKTGLKTKSMPPPTNMNAAKAPGVYQPPVASHVPVMKNTVDAPLAVNHEVSHSMAPPSVSRSPQAPPTVFTMDPSSLSAPTCGSGNMRPAAKNLHMPAPPTSHGFQPPISTIVQGQESGLSASAMHPSNATPHQQPSMTSMYASHTSSVQENHMMSTNHNAAAQYQVNLDPSMYGGSIPGQSGGVGNMMSTGYAGTSYNSGYANENMFVGGGSGVPGTFNQQREMPDIEDPLLSAGKALWGGITGAVLSVVLD